MATIAMRGKALLAEACKEAPAVEDLAVVRVAPPEMGAAVRAVEAERAVREARRRGLPHCGARSA